MCQPVFRGLKCISLFRNGTDAKIPINENLNYTFSIRVGPYREHHESECDRHYDSDPNVTLT